MDVRLGQWLLMSTASRSSFVECSLGYKSSRTKLGHRARSSSNPIDEWVPLSLLTSIVRSVNWGSQIVVGSMGLPSNSTR